MVSSTIHQRKFVKATITDHLDLFLTKTWVRETYDYPEINVFEKASFSKCRSVHTEAQSRLFKGLQIPLVNLKSVFEKLCFGDGLVWTVGLTVETELKIYLIYHLLEMIFTCILFRYVGRLVHHRRRAFRAFASKLHIFIPALWESWRACATAAQLRH